MRKDTIFARTILLDLENNLNLLQGGTKKHSILRGNNYLCPVKLLTKPTSYQQFGKCLHKLIGVVGYYSLFRSRKNDDYGKNYSFIFS